VTRLDVSAPTILPSNHKREITPERLADLRRAAWTQITAPKQLLILCATAAVDLRMSVCDAVGNFLMLIAG
jgi:hypothetical protein